MRRAILWAQLIALYMGAFVSLAPFYDPHWERPMTRVARKILALP